MKSKILKMEVDVSSLDFAVNSIVESRKRKEATYTCLSNVHMCMEVYENPGFSEVVNSADFVLADGRPIFWAQKLLGYSRAQQVRGQSLMSALCNIATSQNFKIGLYGGADKRILEAVERQLGASFPGIQIVYKYCPPFRPLNSDELHDVYRDLDSSGVDILFVGIGCPKQEIWMSNAKQHVRCAMLGVGAAFDFISGNKSHAPRFMQFLGLEWLYRLLSEPKRLWKRYLINNPKFMFYFFLQFLRK